MVTVMLSPGTLWTLLNRKLIPSAAYLIQHDWTRAFPKIRLIPCFGNATQAQLPADHLCVCFIPLVITDGPPMTSMVDFYSAFPRTAPTHEAYGGERRALGKATCDSSCHLLRTRPPLPDVFFTKQYIFFISSATDIAPINGNKAQSRKWGLFCDSFSPQLQLVTNDGGVSIIPVAATDCAPSSICIYFHGAFKLMFATSKPH